MDQPQGRWQLRSTNEAADLGRQGTRWGRGARAWWVNWMTICRLPTRETTVRSAQHVRKHFEHDWKRASTSHQRYRRSLSRGLREHAQGQHIGRRGARARAEQSFADRQGLLVLGAQGHRGETPGEAKAGATAGARQLQKRSPTGCKPKQRAAQAEDVKRPCCSGAQPVYRAAGLRAFRYVSRPTCSGERDRRLSEQVTTCELDRSGADGALEGRTFHCPAVPAVSCGRLPGMDRRQRRRASPVYCGIDQWATCLIEPCTHQLIPLLPGCSMTWKRPNAEGYSRAIPLRRGCGMGAGQRVGHQGDSALDGAT